MIPDRLPVELRALLEQFPSGAVQLEIGIQSFDKGCFKHISRSQNFERLSITSAFCAKRPVCMSTVISSLVCPARPSSSFASGFDQLIAMKPG